MQALYLLALDPVAEATSDPNSYGFRLGRSPADAMAHCFTVLSNRYAPQWIFEGDIRACFDALSHAWLLAHVPMDRRILQQWLKAGFMEQHILYPTTEGAPQGGPLSPVLANLTLTGLEPLLRSHFPQSHAKSTTKVNTIQFADDFIITGASQEVLEQEVRPLVEAFLGERGLELSAEKTVVTHIDEGFDFLGQNVRKYDGKLLIKPSKHSVKTFVDKVRTVVKTHLQAKAGNLICLLNPLLRGWAQYHRHVVSKETFAAVDAAIFKLLWRWAKRRHPHKGARWVRQKYFPTCGRRQWVFSGEVAAGAGQTRTVRLFSLRRVPIRRHVQVRTQANAYDPAWELYFEERLSVTMKQTLNGVRRQHALWSAQAGRCPVCDQSIVAYSEGQVHHIIWRTNGGSDMTSNLVLLHPTCHRQVHSHGLGVRKPCPVRGNREA